MIRQCTLKKPIRAMGVGVHTGEKVYLIIKPASADHGISFRRVDLDPMIEIPARSEFVGDTRFSTSLVKEGVRISTVEHLLSAMAGLGIDNAMVDISAGELPIMDGSAGPFVFLLQSAGIVKQEVAKRFLRVTKSIKVSVGDAWATLKPYDGFKVKVKLDYEHPMFKQAPQEAELELSRLTYIKEISRARTYGFLADYEWLRENNLAKGASLDNTIVLDDFRVLNEDGLRYKDEWVKHKMLDVIGDLYLAQYSILGAFSAFKPGHGINNLLLETLLAKKDAYEIITLEGAEEMPARFWGELGFNESIG